MLRPIYTRRPFELLIVGPPFSGKRTLSEQLLKNKDVYVKINVADTLPNRHLDRVDYVIIMVDMTNLSSKTLLYQLLNTLTPSYLSTKVSVVVTKVDKCDYYVFEKEEIRQWVESYFDIPLFYVNLNIMTEKRLMSEQLMRVIQINTLQHSNINTLFIRSIEVFDTYNDNSRSSVSEQSMSTVNTVRGQSE
ncbi:hypothetical protein BDB01DRAFT_263652 [Pilobolus umbonatus]|nr:hypothetical protein BDB01DRAFT_263652 [Pilobolus umbonatus]